MRVNQILGSGASRFDNVEEALEERATIFQLSDLSETVESLAKRVASLEKENAVRDMGYSYEGVAAYVNPKP